MLIGLALGWLGGLWLRAYVGMTLDPVMASAVAVLLALPLLVAGAQLQAKLWVVPLAMFAAAAGSGVQPASEAGCRISGEVEVTARVEAVRHRQEDTLMSLKVIEGRELHSGLPVPDGLELRMSSAHERSLPLGALLQMRARLRPLVRLRNRRTGPLGRDERGLACHARPSPSQPIRVLRAPDFGLWLDDLRARIRRHFLEGLPPWSAAVARALVLGEGSALPYAQRQTIAAVGLSHLFAVSGLHVALVSGTLVRTLQAVFRACLLRMDGRRLAASLGVPLSLLHAAFAGGSPSAWRAAVTAAVSWGLVALDRRPGAGSVTATAALILSGVDPEMALRPAFILSIVATAAILSAPARPGTGLFRRLQRASTISARTLVATAPMVWVWFGGVPLIGWLTNILVLPLGSLVLIPMVHLYALSTPLPELGRWLAPLVRFSSDALWFLCEAFARFATAPRLPPLSTAQALIVLLGCASLLLLRSWRARLCCFVLGIGLWTGAEWQLRRNTGVLGQLRVSFLDVDQGDAALVELPDGRLAIIDTGPGGRHPAAREIRELLAERRRSVIDLLVISHGHPDHAGNLAELLREVRVEELWLNGQRLAEAETAADTQLLAEAARSGTRVRFPEDFCGQPYEAGGASLRVLWPCPRYDPGLDWNDNSLVIRLGFGARSFLFTGDIEAEAEQALVAERSSALKADVLKVAHHGSKTSSTAAFLREVRPDWAVISVGAFNRYGHPSEAVTKRLLDGGARLLRTDQDGGVTMQTRGQELSVETWRQGPLPPRRTHSAAAPASRSGADPMGFSYTR